MTSTKVSVEAVKLECFKEIKDSVTEIYHLMQITQIRPHDPLSKAARYVIGWLTQIETDVYDREIQVSSTQNSFREKICARKTQSPTVTCQSILEKYPRLSKNFSNLLDESRINATNAKKPDDLRPLLDQIGREIISLKHMVSLSVEDNDTTDKYIQSSESLDKKSPKQGV